MHDRVAAGFGVLTFTLALQMAVTASGQPPLTPDGHPDFQGIWVNNSATPLERPAALKDKPTLTDDEVAELKNRAARMIGDARNDFAAGDAFFLAVLASGPIFKNPNATGAATEMVDKVFENRTSLIVDPPDGRVPAWTPDGRLRWNAQIAATLAKAPDGPESLANYVRCITYGVPRLGGNSTDYSNYYQFVQTRDYVVIYGEAIHDARIVPTDGRAHLPQSVRSWNGDSIGRWDGNSLVVDTTNFSPRSRFMGAADDLHIIERFTRASPDVIDYQITLDDPTTWTKPWTAVIHLRRSQDTMFEFACHEGSLELIKGVLAGARAEERAEEDARKRPRD